MLVTILQIGNAVVKFEKHFAFFPPSFVKDNKKQERGVKNKYSEV